MASESLIERKHRGDLLARVEVLEAQSLAMRIILHAIVRSSDDSARTLTMASQDIEAWANRPTSAAHSRLARGARKLALEMIADLEVEEEQVPTSVAMGKPVN
jgi:hypothetical protein